MYAIEYRKSVPLVFHDTCVLLTGMFVVTAVGFAVRLDVDQLSLVSHTLFNLVIVQFVAMILPEGTVLLLKQIVPFQVVPVAHTAVTFTLARGGSPLW